MKKLLILVLFLSGIVQISDLLGARRIPEEERENIPPREEGKEEEQENIPTSTRLARLTIPRITIPKTSKVRIKGKEERENIPPSTLLPIPDVKSRESSRRRRDSKFDEEKIERSVRQRIDDPEIDEFGKLKREFEINLNKRIINLAEISEVINRAKKLELSRHLLNSNFNGSTIWQQILGNTRWRNVPRDQFRIFVKFLIDSGADVNLRSFSSPHFFRSPMNVLHEEYKPYALELAVHEDHPELIQLFLDNGANADNKDKALLEAIKSNKDLRIVQMLVNAGANINAKDINGETALTWAAKPDKSFEVVDWLLKNGADIDNKNKALVESAKTRRHNKRIIQMLLDSGANVNEKDEYDYTPLTWAAVYNNYALVEFLLNNGANQINKNNTLGLVIQENSGMEDQIESLKNIVQILVKSGANVNAQDDDGSTPLSWVAVNKNYALVDFLLEHGANQISKDSALLWTIKMNGDVQMIKKLIDAGADINAQDNEGNTSLTYAVRDGIPGFVEWLLDIGADVFIRDNAKKTIFENIIDDKSVNDDVKRLIKNAKEAGPLIMAAKSGNKSLAEQIIKEGAIDINLIDSYGRTALIWAVVNNHPEIVELLLNNGADAGIIDKHGGKFLDYVNAKTEDKKNKIEKILKEFKLSETIQKTTPLPDELLDLVLQYSGLSLSDEEKSIQKKGEGQEEPMEEGSDEEGETESKLEKKAAGSKK